ncbi:MAG: TIGR04283 family arsenosugar biosynthesis glycosyltransferase [Anderseniella sp.]
MFLLVASIAIVANIMLTVIIPTLNAGAALARTIAVLQKGADIAGIGEIIIADGGSRTLPDAAELGVTLVSGKSGRGTQLAAGATKAQGNWLLFLHADTELDEGWEKVVKHHMESNENAAVFQFALDDGTVQARRLEAIVRWRCKWLALPYGDQGLLISRQLYDKVGGYLPIPLMEDVDIIRRIGRNRLTYLDARAITSASKYLREGYARRMARNLFCLALWSVGVSPQKIARFYE